MPEPVISVRGEASLEVEPEIAIVWVSVQARDADRHRAVELLARRSGAVSSTIKGFGEAVEKLESQPVNVQPVFKDGKARERISGYLARAGFTVTVRDFAVLGEFVTGLADAEMVSVTGPDWRLRPDSPVYRAARLAAARTPPGGRGSTRRRSAGGSPAWSRPPTPGCSHRSPGPWRSRRPGRPPRRAVMKARRSTSSPRNRP